MISQQTRHLWVRTIQAPNPIVSYPSKFEEEDHYLFTCMNLNEDLRAAIDQSCLMGGGSPVSPASVPRG